MDKIIWKYVKPVIDPEMVSDFMKKYDIKLTKAMIKCIIENNGGRPSECFFDTDRRSGYIFQSLFSYNPKDRCNIYSVYPSMFSDTPLFPIGLESAGNIVCYDQKNDNYVLWNHENNECENILKN